MEIIHIFRTRNTRADALSKLATTSVSTLSYQVQVETMGQRSIAMIDTVFCIMDIGVTWMTSIMRYISEGFIPDDKSEACHLVLQATKYVLQDGILYRRAYLQP